jgi:hypothetical protein
MFEPLPAEYINQSCKPIINKPVSNVQKFYCIQLRDEFPHPFQPVKNYEINKYTAANGNHAG